MSLTEIMTLCEDYTDVYLIKDFVLCSINAITQCFNPSLLVLCSLSLELHIMDLSVT